MMTPIVHELTKLVHYMNLIVNRQVDKPEGFQGVEIHQCLHDGSYEGGKGGLPEVHDDDKGKD